jgi:transposase/DNA-directed RNA polymerase subunit RPC12/RpoP
MVSVLLTALVGQVPESSLGWVSYPPGMLEFQGASKPRHRKWRENEWGSNLTAGWAWVQRTWVRALARSEWLATLSLVRIGLGQARFSMLDWAWLLPWGEWALEGLSVVWPWLGRQPEMRVLRWAAGWLRWASLLVCSAQVVGHWLASDEGLGQGQNVFAGVGFLSKKFVWQIESEEEEEPISWIAVKRVSDGWQVWFGNLFYLPVQEGDVFQLRQTILLLRRLEGARPRRGSRATRDGRRPLIAQQALARVFEVTQPEISRWERYEQEQDWANLLSLHSSEVLTTELREQIIEVCAQFPWWSRKRVYEHLRQCGVTVTHPQVRQAMRESGWNRLQQTMNRFFVLGVDSIRPRDESLVAELLGMVQQLVGKLEAGEGLTPQIDLQIAHLKTACQELGIAPASDPAMVPWARKVIWLLFAAETTAQDDVIRCTYCGSTDVRPKGRKPRLKRYQDENRQWQSVEVYRYRCRNPACSYASFTHFPLALLPYSPYPLHMRIAALQMYAWGRSSYRRTAQALGVRAGRVYLWVSAFGRDLLPVAALFGVVRCSGVVGIDEKWVQVPDKAPRGSGRSKPPKPRRWMYVYLAVDVYTYDLLHIALYQRNSAHSTRAFLLALKAKGYQPTVIVTDLRSEYGPAIDKVFDQARHHECIFHALQWTHRQLKDTYGAHYAKTRPDVVQLKVQIDAIFQTKTRRTAEKRYRKVMALREQYVAQTPAVDSVFSSLERHWPTLANGIESTIIPRTNNATELVIRRFDQHYQNFCGFESLTSARLFLAVFEKVYRFTPFTPDAQPRIRNKCPLELAGYDLTSLPMAQICRGWALHWAATPSHGVVPNV